MSTDEQANKGYSLRDQEQKLLKHCELHNHNVLKVYSDDHSAKTFKRPSFQQLLEFCKHNKSKVDELLFVKWDRFSRNTTESYNMIETFEAMGIVVNAIEQPIDLSIPEQGLMLAVYLSMPQVENHRRSLNVIAGLRRAYKEGRYVGSPPKGYIMGRDSLNKPILTPNEDAVFIKEGFKLLSTGIYNQREIRDKLSKKGFKVSKTSFSRILRNPIYYGKVIIKAYVDEPETTIEGIHEPLITQELFDKVQSILDRGKKQNGKIHKKVNGKFPLKGFIVCPNCGKSLSASSSKGRNNYYSYYHCFKPCDSRYRSEDIDKLFLDFLKGITLNEPTQRLLETIVNDKLTKMSQKKAIGPTHHLEKKKLNEKIERVRELYIDQELDKSEYIDSKEKYLAKLQELENKEKAYEKKKEIAETYKTGFKNLVKFDKLFINSSLDDKRKLLGSIFPEKFQISEKKVRTADINPLLLEIASINKGLEKIKKRDKPEISDLSRYVARTGLEPVTSGL